MARSSLPHSSFSAARPNPCRSQAEEAQLKKEKSKRKGAGSVQAVFAGTFAFCVLTFALSWLRLRSFLLYLLKKEFTPSPPYRLVIGALSVASRPLCLRRAAWPMG